jgi:hypothetical protein
MAGFTDNLPEAIRAFDEGREPVYLDDPRRDLFSVPDPVAGAYDDEGDDDGGGGDDGPEPA